MKNIHNILAYMVSNDIEFENLSQSDVVLLEVTFNLTDKQLRGLILYVMKNGYEVNFSINKCFIQDSMLSKSIENNEDVVDFRNPQKQD